MGAAFPNEITVYVVAADVNGSSLASSDQFETNLTNFSQSGGEREEESIPTFGGANITKENPREQFEVSFEGIVQYGTNATLFDSFVMGATINSSSVESSQEPSSKAIYLQWTDGTNFYTRAYNNITATNWEPEMAADNMLKGTVTFKLPPTDEAGASNVQVAKAAASTLTW